MKFNGFVGTNAAADIYLTLYRDAVALTPSGVNAIASVAVIEDSWVVAAPMDFVDSPATTSEVIYSVYWKVGANTGYLGRRGLDTAHDLPNILTVEEIPA